MSPTPTGKELVRRSILEAAARNLREFGYPSASEDNVLTDDIFRRFFASMLDDQIEQGVGNALQRETMKELRAECRKEGDAT